MGSSHDRIRPYDLAARCCHGAFYAVGFLTATVIFMAMLWIVWCYFGLSILQLSDSQRRALVNYPLTTVKPQISTVSPLAAAHFNQSADDVSIETSLNTISKSMVTTSSSFHRGASRGESQLKSDHEKKDISRGNASLAKGDFADRDRAAPGAKDLSIASTVPPLRNSETDDGKKKDAILSGESNVDDTETRRIASSDGNRQDSGEPLKDVLEKGDSSITPLKVHDPVIRTDAKPTDDISREEKRTSSREYPHPDRSSTTRRDEIQSSRRSDADTPYRNPHFDEEDSSRTYIRDRTRYDDDDDRGSRSRYDTRNRARDRVRDIDDRYSKGDTRLYPDDGTGRTVDDRYRDETISSEERYERKPDLPRRRGDDDRVREHEDRYRYRGDRPRYRDDDPRYESRDRRYEDRDEERYITRDEGRYRLRDLDSYRPRDDKYRTRYEDRDESRAVSRDRSTVDDRDSSIIDDRDRSIIEDMDRSRVDDKGRSRIDDRERSRYDDRDRSTMDDPDRSRIDDKIKDDGKDLSRTDDRYRTRSESVDRSRVDDRYETRYENRGTFGGEDRYRLEDKDKDRSRIDDRYRTRDDDRDRLRDEDDYRSRVESRRRTSEGKLAEESPQGTRYLERGRYRPRDEDRYKDDTRPITRERTDELTPLGISPLPNRKNSNVKGDTEDPEYDYPTRGSVRSNLNSDGVSRTILPETRKRDREDEYRRPSRYDDRDRISPTRVRDETYATRSTPLDSRSRSERPPLPIISGSRHRDRYPEDITRMKDTKYYDEEDRRRISASSEDSSRRSQGNDRREYRTRLPNERTDTKYDDRGVEVVLDRRSYSSDEDDDSEESSESTAGSYDGRTGTRRRGDDDEYDHRSRTDESEYPRRRIDEDEEIRRGGDYDASRTRHRDDKYSRDDDRYEDDRTIRKYDDTPRRRDEVGLRKDERPFRNVDDISSPPLLGREYPQPKADDEHKPAVRRYPSTTSVSSEGARVHIGNRIRSPSDDARTPHRNGYSADPDRTVPDSARQEYPSGGARSEERPLNAKDVIEAALRHSDRSDPGAMRKVSYPVFDPRGSNLTSPDVIRPSERRGSTIQSRKKRWLSV